MPCATTLKNYGATATGIKDLGIKHKKVAFFKRGQLFSLGYFIISYYLQDEV